MQKIIWSVVSGALVMLALATPAHAAVTKA